LLAGTTRVQFLAFAGPSFCGCFCSLFATPLRLGGGAPLVMSSVSDQLLLACRWGCVHFACSAALCAASVQLGRIVGLSVRAMTGRPDKLGQRSFAPHTADGGHLHGYSITGLMAFSTVESARPHEASRRRHSANERSPARVHPAALPPSLRACVSLRRPCPS